MVKRISIGLRDGAARLRVSPPGLDVDSIAAAQCTLSEQAFASEQVITQTGVVVYTGADVFVPTVGYSLLPMPYFYAVADNSDSWRLPGPTDQFNSRAVDATVTTAGITIRSLSSGVSLIYMLARRA